MRLEESSSGVAWALIAAATLYGCAQILGGDDYKVEPKPGAGGGGGTALAAGTAAGGVGLASGGVQMDAPISECRVSSDCEPVEACRIASCVDGQCKTTLKPSGSDCSEAGGKRCDATGACVLCRVDDVQNDAETDTDCGGPDCGPCADLLACQTDSDCASHVCRNGICFPATCIDGQRNGDEGDVDCGGSCLSRCAQGKSCNEAVDCATGYCADGVCCGVPCDNRCEMCVPGTGACELIPADMDPEDECPGFANLCDGSGQCLECTDATKNGEETDRDCGGPVCDPCATGSCVLDRDCASCTCENGSCAAPRCDDGQKEGCESDVDCGGPCPPCGIGQSCRVKADCTLFNCVEGVCVQ